MPEPAGELRAAAQRLRTLAEAVPAGRWVANGRWNVNPLDAVSNIATADGLVLMMPGTTGRDILARPAALDYVLAMHPGVALALAALFDRWAWMVELDHHQHARVGGEEIEALARLVLEAK